MPAVKYIETMFMVSAFSLLIMKNRKFKGYISKFVGRKKGIPDNM
jgi:hypothetical protein